MDLYARLGKELRGLFKDLFDPRMEGVVQNEMAKIAEIAEKIGGSIKIEADSLMAEIAKYLENPEDEKLLSLMKKHALRLEQETREI